MKPSSESHQFDAETRTTANVGELIRQVLAVSEGRDHHRSRRRLKKLFSGTNSQLSSDWSVFNLTTADINLDNLTPFEVELMTHWGSNPMVTEYLDRRLESEAGGTVTRDNLAGISARLDEAAFFRQLKGLAEANAIKEAEAEIPAFAKKKTPEIKKSTFTDQTGRKMTMFIVTGPPQFLDKFQTTLANLDSLQTAPDESGYQLENVAGNFLRFTVPDKKERAVQTILDICLDLST